MQRTSWIPGVLVATASLFFLAESIVAQDPLTVAPKMYKLRTENERIRVLEVSFPPGTKIEQHSHPDHMAYALSGGSLKIHKGEGLVQDADLKTGDVLWIPAETHWAENTGPTTVRLLVVELKEGAKAPMPMPASKSE
ncbi:MAG TPA: cupin domain-containing protein [bacterium]|nr:cupin domain-containing protein [bacterium]